MALGDRMTASKIERHITCEKCNKTYRQVLEDQAAGFRMLSEDECPYCGHVRAKSMSSEYSNYKLEE